MIQENVFFPLPTPTPNFQSIQNLNNFNYQESFAFNPIPISTRMSLFNNSSTLPTFSLKEFTPTPTPTPTTIFVTFTSTIVQLASPASEVVPTTLPLPTNLSLENLSSSTSSTSSTKSTSLLVPSPTTILNSTTAEHGLRNPSKEEVKLIWISIIYLILLILFWNMILIREFLYSFKILINLIHEIFHIFIGILTGAKISSISIDPDRGAITGMMNGNSILILFSGYLGSNLIGSALIMSSFDIFASKIAFLCIFPLYLICFYFSKFWSKLKIVIGMSIGLGFFFANHAKALRYYILFLGILNSFFFLFDSIDDFLFKKQNESDISLFSKLFLTKKISIQTWFLIWFIVSLGFVSLGFILGFYFFSKNSFKQQELINQSHFLPI